VNGRRSTKIPIKHENYFYSTLTDNNNLSRVGIFGEIKFISRHIAFNFHFGNSGFLCFFSFRDRLFLYDYRRFVCTFYSFLYSHADEIHTNWAFVFYIYIQYGFDASPSFLYFEYILVLSLFDPIHDRCRYIPSLKQAIDHFIFNPNCRRVSISYKNSRLSMPLYNINRYSSNKTKPSQNIEPS